MLTAFFKHMRNIIPAHQQLLDAVYAFLHLFKLFSYLSHYYPEFA